MILAADEGGGGIGLLIEHLLAGLSAEDSVLIKGSRAARMDEVVRQLQDQEVVC